MACRQEIGSYLCFPLSDAPHEALQFAHRKRNYGLRVDVQLEQLRSLEVTQSNPDRGI